MAIRAIMAEGQQRLPAVHRHDQVGIVARGLLADLRQALDGQGGLSLVYQPKHDQAGRIKGVEALLRWTHPKHGPIIPPVIVALAEESGEIHRLGRWIAEEAIACKARWNERGFADLTVAINVSPAQLTNAAMPTYLKNALEKHGIGADEIELEITESSVIPNSQIVDETLQRLSETGIRLSMDDFGMGYSSLLYMRRFRVHAIKIDGSLTKDVLSNSTNADIIRTIASLGRAQQVEVVAEFVETGAQREMLSHLGCDLFQGYFHSPPLSEQKALAYFAHHRAIFADLTVPPAATRSPLSEAAIKVQVLSRDANTTRLIADLQATLGAEQLRICPQESQVRAGLQEFRPDVLIVDGEIGSEETRNIVSYVRDKLCLDGLSIVVVNADGQLYESLRQAIPGHIDYVLFKPLDRAQLTERLLALGRQLEFKRFNTNVLDQISEGVIVIDETGKIQSFNKAAEELFGWTAAEIVGRSVNNLMPAHHQERHADYMHRYEQTGQGRIIGSGRLEEGLRKDGTLFHMHLKVIDISDGAMRRYVGIIRRIGDSLADREKN